jgi:hypothetical protein
MAYQIDKFNGTFLVSIDDQTINTTATNLKLVGRNYAGYGEIQNENFLHLLENFASTTAPPRSLEGQIWYDSSTKKLKYFDGQRYKSAAGAEVSSSAPAGLSSGEFWFDNQEKQLYTWSGSEFVLIGPERTPTDGDTLARPKIVKDVLGNNKSILEFTVGNKVIAVLSKEEFVLNPTVNPIEGFSIIRLGINLVDIDPSGISTTSNYRIWGTATNSQRLNGLSSDDFLRSSNTEFRSQVKFLDSGIVIGDQNDLRIRVINGNEPVIENTIGGNIILRIVTGVTPRDIAIIREDGILPGNNDQYFLGKPGIRWKEINAEKMQADTFYGKFVGTIESPAPGEPGGPPIGQPVPPLAIQSVAVSGNFSMAPSTAPGSPPSNFEINLAGSTGSVSLYSGEVGYIDNFSIGMTNPNQASFTALTASGDVSISSTAITALSVAGGGFIGRNLIVDGTITSNSTAAIKVPVGTTVQRPIPLKGMIRFNDTDGLFEGYNGADWIPIGGALDEDYGLITGSPDIFIDYGGLF